MIGKIYEGQFLIQELPRIGGRHKDDLALTAFCPPFGFFQIQTFIELPANGTSHITSFHYCIHPPLKTQTYVCVYATIIAHKRGDVNRKMYNFRDTW